MSNLIEAISASKKPVVVHNGILDLMHVICAVMQVYRRFIGRLPPTVEEYKSRLNQVFPVIYDTKFMCSTSVVIYTRLKKATDLKSCYEGLRAEGKYPPTQRSPKYRWTRNARSTP